MRKCEHERTDEALHVWFIQQREKGVPISGPILKEKALQFYKQLEDVVVDGQGKFTASDGWLFRWKKRYGIRQLQICGEKLSAENQLTELETFKHRFHAMLAKKGLTGDQIYNCDETGLYYRMLPSKTLVAQEESSAPGYKKNKDRVTVMSCSNVTGSHKLDLVVIGKSKNPRAFKQLSNRSTLPVYYTHQKSAWMNSTIFKTWFDEKFVPDVTQFLESKNLPRRAILLMDNAPSHPNNLRDRGIRVWFLPPNVTSICQPMDQGVLECLKKKYRHKLLSSVLSDTNDTMSQKLKKIDILDVIRWIADSWSEIEPITLVKSWRKLLDHKASDQWEEADTEDEQEIANEDLSLISLLQKFPGCDDIEQRDIIEWIRKDDDVEYTDDDIVQLVTRPDEEEEEDDRVEGETVVSKITHAEGFKIFEKAISYVAQQKDCNITAADLILLRKWRDFAAKRRITCGRQSTLNDFF